jgi:hypothetical protein
MVASAADAKTDHKDQIGSRARDRGGRDQSAPLCSVCLRGRHRAGRRRYLALTSMSSSPSGSVTCTAQAMQGSKL